MRATLAVPVAVAGLMLAAPAARASCAATLDWHGSSYIGYGGKDRPKLGAKLKDKATRPVCHDTPTAPPAAEERPTKVAVHRLRGIPAAIAIHADSGGVYVNGATFVNLRSHPLHTLYGSDRHARRDGERCTVTGVAEVQAFGIELEGRTVTVAADTRVELKRYGTGYVPGGTKVRVTGSCHDDRIDATRIARG